jgi:hypothetical protein
MPHGHGRKKGPWPGFRRRGHFDCDGGFAGGGGFDYHPPPFHFGATPLGIGFLGQHGQFEVYMATYLAAIVCCIVVLRGIIRLIHKTGANKIDQDGGGRPAARYLACFISGALFTNAVPHFIHGMSGEYFPAPFGKYLGKGFPEYFSNVVWGFINMVVGYNQFVAGRVASPSKWGKWWFFAGVLVMSGFLCLVFSHFNQ